MLLGAASLYLLSVGDEQKQSWNEARTNRNGEFSFSQDSMLIGTNTWRQTVLEIKTIVLVLKGAKMYLTSTHKDIFTRKATSVSSGI